MPIACIKIKLARTIHLRTHNTESKNLGVVEALNFSEREPVSNEMSNGLRRGRGGYFFAASIVSCCAGALTAMSPSGAASMPSSSSRWTIASSCKFVIGNGTGTESI
jgi:hypothetical protein